MFGHHCYILYFLPVLELKMWHRNTVIQTVLRLSPCPGPLLFVSDGSSPVRPGRSSSWTSRDRQNWDHQGLGEGPGQTVCGLQLLRWTRLQGQQWWKTTFIFNPHFYCILHICFSCFIHWILRYLFIYPFPCTSSPTCDLILLNNPFFSITHTDCYCVWLSFLLCSYLLSNTSRWHYCKSSQCKLHSTDALMMIIGIILYLTDLYLYLLHYQSSKRHYYVIKMLTKRMPH